MANRQAEVPGGHGTLILDRLVHRMVGLHGVGKTVLLNLQSGPW